MNVFKFLRSNAGRVVIGPMRAAGLLIGASVLGVSAWNAANPPEPAKNAPIRSFSQIARGVNHGEGIMVDGRGVQLATAEERARFDGSANNFGLDSEANVANITADSVRGAGSSGDAYRFGASDGLSRDKDAAESPAVAAALARARAAGAAQGAGAQTEGVGAAAKAAQNRDQGKEGDGGNKLQRRSVSGMSGGGSGLSAVASAGGTPSAGAVGRAPRIGGADTPVLTGPKSISGAMPESSLMVSSRRMGRSAGFDRAHDGRAARGGQSAEGRSLLDIAKSSAKIAARSNKGVNKANEAITPFMGGELSGGLSVDGKEDFSDSSSGSADFDTPREEKERNLNNAFDDIDLTEEKREERRKNLLSRMFALILSSLGAMMAVAALVEVAKAASGWGSIFAWIGIGIIIAAQMTAWGFYCAEAGKYNSTYHSGGWLGASIGMTLVVAAGFALTCIFGKAAEKGAEKGVGIGLKGWLMMGLGGISAGLGSAQSIIQSRDAIMDYKKDKDGLDLGK